MDSQKILYSPGGNDERYTPVYAITPLLKYIPKDKKIWCPFDTHESNFIKVFTDAGYDVVYSHINYGQDFFTYEPESWDIIVSNPPFTNKRQFFERAIALGKPFALLMTNTWLNDAAPKIIFREAGIDLELMMFDKRVEFIRPEGESPKKITFSSSYYCHGILPKQIVIEYLQKEVKICGC